MKQEQIKQEQTVIRFEEGMYGFESIKDYILLQEDESGFIWHLDAVEGLPSFITVNPFLLVEDYAPLLSAEDIAYFGNPKPEDLCFLAITALREDLAQSSVNLKSPVVIHVGHKRGKQVILENADYSVRSKCFAQAQEGGNKHAGYQP